MPIPVHKSLALIPLAFLALALGPSAQEPGGDWGTAKIYLGDGPNHRLGEAITTIGDLNGDGVRELVFSAPGADPLGTIDGGTVFVRSGADGLLIHEIHGSDDRASFGVAVAAGGDFDGDLIPDVVVGAPLTDAGGKLRSGSVYVYSGADASEILRVDGILQRDEFGSAVACPGDLSGDGVPDLVIGAPRASPGGVFRAGVVFAVSGADGSTLHVIPGNATLAAFGSSVAALPDLDGDTVPDYIFGAPDNNAGEFSLVSGATGTVNFREKGNFGGERVGASVASLGDLDGDLIGEFIVGATYGFTPSGAVGHVTVYSGATGAVLHRFFGSEASSQFGYAVASAGDADLDGTPDILIGAPFQTIDGNVAAGQVALFSGVDFRELASFGGERSFDQLGNAVQGAGDLDGDGWPAWLTSVWLTDFGARADTGQVRVHEFHHGIDASSSEVSVTNGGTVQLPLDMPFERAMATYYLLGSFTGTSPGFTVDGVTMPLVADDLFYGILQGIQPFRIENSPGVLDLSGDAEPAIVIPPSAANLSETIPMWFAAILVDGPSPIVATRAVRVDAVP